MLLSSTDRQPRRELHFAHDDDGSQSRYLTVAGHEFVELEGLVVL